MSHGIYILVIELAEDTYIKIGGLGMIYFTNGWYLYVGSGQTNVEKRVSRHFNKIKKPRWHIDYLVNHDKASPKKALILNLSKKFECKISKFMESINCEPIIGFGSTDCNCKAHLYKHSDPEFLLNEILHNFGHKLKYYSIEN